MIYHADCMDILRTLPNGSVDMILQDPRIEVWMIVLIGILFGLIETAYFGWNFFPQSNAEIICDRIAILITVQGLRYG